MRKVLVLEDEDNIRSFVVLNLNRAGYNTLEATTGEEALEILKEHPETRIALLDVNLPGIDGFEVCRRIRATNSKIGHHHAHRPDPGDGQGDRPDDRRGRLRDQALLPGGADRSGGRPVPPQRRRGEADGQRRDRPAALPAQHPQPDAGEERHSASS